MSASELVSIYSHVTGLMTIWNYLAIKNKIALWFGLDYNSKTPKPFL